MFQTEVENCTLQLNPEERISHLLRGRSLKSRIRQKLYRKSKHFLRSVTLFFENRVVYEIMWKK